AQWIGKRIYQLPNEEGDDYIRPTSQQAYTEFLEAAEERGKDLPSFTKSIMPILVPIILIFINTRLTAIDEAGVLAMNDTLMSYTQFIRYPIIAVGFVFMVANYTLINNLSK